MPESLRVIDLSGTLCCPPMAGGELTDSEALEVALRLKDLADPVRVRIVSMLIQQDPGGRETRTGRIAWVDPRPHQQLP